MWPSQSLSMPSKQSSTPPPGHAMSGGKGRRSGGGEQIGRRRQIVAAVDRERQIVGMAAVVVRRRDGEHGRLAAGGERGAGEAAAGGRAGGGRLHRDRHDAAGRVAARELDLDVAARLAGHVRERRLGRRAAVERDVDGEGVGVDGGALERDGDEERAGAAAVGDRLARAAADHERRHQRGARQRAVANCH